MSDDADKVMDHYERKRAYKSAVSEAQKAQAEAARAAKDAKRGEDLGRAVGHHHGC